MAEGVAAIQQAEELRAAVKTLRDLVRVFGLSWDEDALYIVEHELGFPMGDETDMFPADVEIERQSDGA